MKKTKKNRTDSPKKASVRFFIFVILLVTDGVQRYNKAIKYSVERMLSPVCESIKTPCAEKEAIYETYILRCRA